MRYYFLKTHFLKRKLKLSTNYLLIYFLFFYNTTVYDLFKKMYIFTKKNHNIFTFLDN